MSNPLALQIPIEELAHIVEQGSILKQMATDRKRTVVVDYIPARASMTLPRTEDGEPLKAYKTEPITLTFTLEDAMFGGICFVALCCGHRVVVSPFPWTTYDDLAKIRLTRQ